MHINVNERGAGGGECAERINLNVPEVSKATREKDNQANDSQWRVDSVL